jgi:CRP-like cAMP-binding protein
VLPPGVARRRREGWTGQPGLDAARLASLPLFRGVEPAVLDQAADAAKEVVAAAGQVLVRQWDAARELYVILEGSARAHRGETELRHLVPGDHFGELGALDWGSSFSYPRTATVTATSPLRALVLPGPLLTSLVRSSPVLGQRIRASVHQRLGADNEC